MSTKTGFVAGAVFALVVGTGTAYAATGGNFILGKFNRAGTVTTLKNPNGPALNLQSRVGTPPLKVGNGVKVPRLHADRLDGKDASAFALASGRTGVIEATGIPMDFDENGATDAIVAAAECPTGTMMTGGGAVDFTVTGFHVVNAPADGRTWMSIVVVDEATPENPEDLVASVVCYNPKGAVPGAMTRMATERSTVDREMSPQMARRVASAEQ